MPRIIAWPLSFVLCLSGLFPVHSAPWDRLGPTGGRIPALVVAPSNSSIVYAGNAFVYRSSDGGSHWARTADVFPLSGPDVAAPQVRSLAVSPADPNRVAVASPQGLYITTDGGVTWKRAGSVAVDVSAVSFSLNGRQVYALASGTMYRSQDGGDTWGATTAPAMAAMAWDPKVATGLFGLRATPDTSGRQLYRTDDGTVWYAFSSFSGPVFTTIQASTSGDAAYVSSPSDTNGGIWRVTRAGVATQIYTLPVSTIAVTRVNPCCVIAARSSGYPPVVRTCNDGVDWETLTVGFTARGALSLAFGPGWMPIAGTERGGVMTCDNQNQWHTSNTGLAASSVSGVAQLSPSSRVLLAAASDGLCRSTNDGDSWYLTHNSATRSVMAASEAKSGRVWHTGVDGLERSDDFGQTWLHFTTGLAANVDIGRIIAHPSLENTVFIVTAQGAVYQSTTGNSNWIQRFPAWGTAPSSIPDLVISPADPTIVFTTRPDGIYRSTDGGLHWTLRTNSVPAGAMLCASPSSSAILYRASTIGSVVWVSRSTDGGANWSAIRQETGAANSGFAATFLAIDPRQPNRILLGTNRGLRISDDGGTTWRVEPIGTAGTFASGWAPCGATGDFLTTGGAGVLRCRPQVRSALSAPDAVRIIALARSSISPTQTDLDFGDLNDDGKITIADADLALRSAIGP